MQLGLSIALLASSRNAALQRALALVIAALYCSAGADKAQSCGHLGDVRVWPDVPGLCRLLVAWSPKWGPQMSSRLLLMNGQ